MTITASPRFGIHRWDDDDDIQNRTQFDEDHEKIDNLAAISLGGLRADRPAPAIRDRYYRCSDTHELFYDDGAAWSLVGLPLYPLPLHIGGLLTTGIKAPKLIVPHAGVVVAAHGICDLGSGVTWQLRHNSALPTGMAASAATGTAVVTNDFDDFTVAALDILQVEITDDGTNAYDLSVAALLYWT